MDTRTQITNAIDEITKAGDKLTISSVAKKCCVSHSLIYNRYPDLKEKIKELGAEQKLRKKGEADADLITNLMDKNKKLKAKLATETSNTDDAAFKKLLVHTQEIYSMYDQLLEERNRLAQRLAS
jgi:AcrR family transcriptional regulator